MKRTLIILTVIGCLVVAALFSRSLYQQDAAVEQSSELVMMVTTDFLVNWDPETVREHGSAELLGRESADQLQRRYLPMSRRLGALQEIYDIKYEVDIPGWWQGEAPARASYSMLARFESEVATVSVQLIRQGDRWLISHYNIEPPAIAA
ncbi:MAG: hypothetical protein WD071_13945 [Pseudohongiella sp.]|uniref:hypothetical protein n=1 Tax=Pseudohongiella sp. TaxID=1979412 RepID=UPI0034A03A17